MKFCSLFLFCLSHQHQHQQGYIPIIGPKANRITAPFANTETWRRRRKPNHGLFVTSKPPNLHFVEGVECREVSIDISIASQKNDYDFITQQKSLQSDHKNDVMTVTILEATASSQDALVDAALRLDDDDESLLYSSPSDGLKDFPSLQKGDPYGAVLWPASSAVAQYFLATYSNRATNNAQTPQQSPNDNIPHRRGLTVLDLGAGTGLVSIASSILAAEAAAAALRDHDDKNPTTEMNSNINDGICYISRVIAADYESLPLHMLQYSASYLNPIPMPHQNENQQISATTQKSPQRQQQQQQTNHDIKTPNDFIDTVVFDVCNHKQPLPQADIVLAADILYEPKTARAMAHRAYEALQKNCRVIVGCSPGRPGRPAFVQTLNDLLGSPNKVEFKVVVGQTCVGSRNELICDAKSTSISKVPKPLPVHIMDLDPSMFFPSLVAN